MPDWENLERVFADASRDAVRTTDEKLASRISSFTRLTNEEIINMCPQPADAQKLVELMKIVKSAEDINVKMNRIVENSEKLGGIVLTLLSKFT